MLLATLGTFEVRATGGFCRAARPPTRSFLFARDNAKDRDGEPSHRKTIPHAFDRPAQSGLDRRLLASPGHLYPEHDPFWILDLFP
jgi:hypothetical protein